MSYDGNCGYCDQGGYVEFHRGAWRVHGVLSVSRSIGDAHLKHWVLGEPETKILQLTPDMEFVVLASDGLWIKVNEIFMHEKIHVRFGIYLKKWEDLGII